MRSRWIGLVLVLAGCPEEVPRRPALEIIDAGVIEVDAGSPIDAGPPAPSSLEPTVVAGFADGGSATVSSTVEIDAASTLTVSLPIKLKDFRIRLLDFREQIVPSDDEFLADGRTYLITLPQPLKTGRSYSLVLDAELGPVVTDDSGGTWNDWALVFKVSGDVQPEPGPAKKPGKPKKKK